MIYKNFSRDLLKKFLLIGIAPTIVISSLLFARIYFIFEDLNAKSHARVLKDIAFYSDSLLEEIEDETAFLQKNFHSIDLQRFIQANDEIETLTIFERSSGKVLDLVSDYNLSDSLKKHYLEENPFQLYKNTKEASFNFVHHSIHAQGKTIAYVIPTQKYIFVFDVNFSILKSYVDYLKKSVDYIILIADQNGNYILNTSSEPYFHNNFFTTEYYKKVVKKYKPLEYVEFFNEEQDIDNFMVYYKSKHSGWFLVTIEDYDSLDDQVLALLPFVLTLLPLIILIIILSARKFTRRIVIPLEILIKKMENFSKGNDPEKLKIEDVEYSLFQRMINAFNTMQDTIFKREYELKHANELLVQKSKEISKINSSLKERVKKEIEKNRKKDQQMLQHSRLAQMGEMISMIAHQWRQPLTAINSAAIALQIKASRDKLDKEKTIMLAQKISLYSQHLSTTIDDFRNFFKPNKRKEETTYTEIIKSVLNIIETFITTKDITLIQKLESDLVFHTYPNELKQVLLNILKNAEEILCEREVKDPKIYIMTQDNRLIIQDNGGGIDEAIIDKIFDPYFSTKSEKNGTGLGLYMSKMIIEDHCQGKLSVSNNEKGAVFTIELPLSLEEQI